MSKSKVSSCCFFLKHKLHIIALYVREVTFQKTNNFKNHAEGFSFLPTVRLFFFSSYFLTKRASKLTFNTHPVALTAVDSALMPSMLPLVKREDISPMEVTNNLQASGVFKVNYYAFFV